MELLGKRVYLRQIDYADTDLIVAWRNQDSVRRYFLNQDLFTKQSHEKWMKEQVMTGKTVQFIITENESGDPIGSVYIRDIDRKNQKGEFGIFIGEEQKKGLGFGTEAARLIIRYAFEELGLNKVFLRVQADNGGAIKAYKKAGFQYEGCFREDVNIGSEYVDIVFMGILRDEEGYAKRHRQDGRIL